MIPTPCVPTLKGPTSAAVLVGIRVMEETAQVNICLICFNGVVKYFRALSHCSFNLLAVIPGCSPSCGLNAVCQESDGRPVCACIPGFQGDGYNCTGWLNDFSLLCFDK